MLAKQATYLDVLSAPRVQMHVPVFQRRYTWSEWQCDELVRDIFKAGTTGEDHFIGSIVFTSEDIAEDGPVDTLLSIIDGQQRTTTAVLLLIALCEHLENVGTLIAGMTAQDVRSRFLVMQEADVVVPKFVSSASDEPTMNAILFKTELPQSFRRSNRIVENYEHFVSLFDEGVDLDMLWAGLNRLFTIVVELQERDNPQLIFESINSKGLGLATSDLLRNRLFYGNDEATQEHLLLTYWEPLESLFTGEDGPLHFNAALRRWLVEEDPELARYTLYEFYGVFRTFIDDRYAGKTEQLMIDLLESCTNSMKVINGPMMVKHLNWAKGHGGMDLGNGVALLRTKRKDV